MGKSLSAQIRDAQTLDIKIAKATRWLVEQEDSYAKTAKNLCVSLDQRNIDLAQSRIDQLFAFKKKFQPVENIVNIFADLSPKNWEVQTKKEKAIKWVNTWHVNYSAELSALEEAFHACRYDAAIVIARRIIMLSYNFWFVTLLISDFAAWAEEAE